MNAEVESSENNPHSLEYYEIEFDSEKENFTFNEAPISTGQNVNSVLFYFEEGRYPRTFVMGKLLVKGQIEAVSGNIYYYKIIHKY